MACPCCGSMKIAISTTTNALTNLPRNDKPVCLECGVRAETLEAWNLRITRPEALSAEPFMQAALRFAKAHVHSDALDDRYDEREADEAQGEYEAADREYNASKKALVAAYRSLTPSDIAAATMADLYPVGTGVLSKDVDCPWCIAKAGEDCYLQGERGSMYRSSTHVHLCRIKPAEKERNEST